MCTGRAELSWFDCPPTFENHSLEQQKIMSIETGIWVNCQGFRSLSVNRDGGQIQKSKNEVICNSSSWLVWRFLYSISQYCVSLNWKQDYLIDLMIISMLDTCNNSFVIVWDTLLVPIRSESELYKMSVSSWDNELKEYCACFLFVLSLFPMTVSILVEQIDKNKITLQIDWVL